MRLWSIHPKYLDRQGLLGLWRESLLAQKILWGETEAYKNHPQLDRFKACPDSKGAIGYYLFAIAKEAEKRKYKFDASKIRKQTFVKIPVTIGQMVFEWVHLSQKLKKRCAQKQLQNELLMKQEELLTHPLFAWHSGGIEPWEKWKPEEVEEDVPEREEELIEENQQESEEDDD